MAGNWLVPARRCMHLAAFVKERSALFRNGGVDAGVFVCGNEAGDLDSIVSSLSYAYLKDTLDGKPLIPFINSPVPRILDMRGEIQMALKENGLCTKDLLFMDPVLCTASKAQKTLNVVLVDHNELSGRWYRKYPDLKSRVCSIIDHHEDAGHFLDAVPRIVKVCGSTASLIVEMAKNGEMTERLEQLARLLLQTIIFDTVNLTWRQKPIDVEAVQILSSSFLKVKQEGTKVMHELEEAVALVPEDGFDIYDLLHKDYKLYVHYPKNSVIYYGISTLHIPFSVMLGSDNKNLDKWMESVQRFMADEDIQLLLMTNAVRERGSAAHSQQFAIFSNPKHSALVTKLYELLQSKDVGLELIISGANFALYNQHNITISRKQFHPITRAFMATQFP